MGSSDEAKFVLHGLDVDNRIVRASVFVQKLKTLLSALRIADTIANGKPTFMYMVTKLETGSAAVTVREKQVTRNRPLRSSIDFLESTASAIYNGDRNVEHLPEPLVKQIGKLGKGVEKNFSHAELTFSDETVIRIDDYLLKQAEVAYETLKSPEQKHDRYYRGIAIGSFDGFLKEIDARGTMLRGKLVLTAGGIEIDCVMNKDRVREAGNSFDKRVIIEGAAHYDGERQIPARLDIKSLRVVGDDSNLLRWRGAFKSDVDVNDDWDDADE
jgi:uncharacterized protein YpiB (UPF0302 family)